MTRAVRELTRRISILSDEVQTLRSNSIVIEKDVYGQLKNDIVDQVNKKNDENTRKVEELIRDIPTLPVPYCDEDHAGTEDSNEEVKVVNDIDATIAEVEVVYDAAKEKHTN